MGEFLLPLFAAEAPLVLGSAPAGALITAGASGATAGAGISGLTAIAGAGGAGGLFGSGLTAGDAFSGVGALSSVAGGRQAQAGAEFEAAQFREEQANARAAAAQDEAQRRRQLSRTLSSITALRAGRGVEMFGGGTGDAIRRQVTTEAEEDISTSRLNFLNRSRRFGLSAEQAELRGTGELLGGFGTAAAILGKSFART